MKNTLKLESKLAKTLVENANYCNRYINEKDFNGYKQYMDTLNTSFYAYYLEVEKDGEKVKDFENTCFQNLRNFLAFVGKVNGVNIKAGSKTGDNSTLFLDCVAFCHKTKKRVKSTALASLICERKSLLTTAKSCLEKDDIKGYKANNEKAKAVTKQIDELQAKSGNADKMSVKQSVNAFSRLFEERLRMVIIGQLSQSEEELKAEKEKLNAERKARRNANKQTAEKQAKATPKKDKKQPKNADKKATEKQATATEKVA